MPHSPLPTHTPILQTYLNPNITVPFSSRPTGHLVILNHSKYLHLLLVTFYSFSIWLIPAHSQSSVQCSFANNPPPMTYAERLAFPLALLSIKLSWTPPPNLRTLIIAWHVMCIFLHMMTLVADEWRNECLNEKKKINYDKLSRR